MPDFRRANCRNCDGHRSEVGSISWSGLCVPCGTAIEIENVLGLMEKNNPKVTNRWRVGMILCAGGSLPETLQPRELTEWQS